MSTVTKQVLIIVKQQGLDQVTTSLKGLDATSTKTTKSTNGLGTAWDKQKASTLNLRTGVHNLDTSEKKADKTTQTFTKSTDKAAKSTSGLAAKFQGNKGLIFSTVGIATAGLEAVGMFQQYQNATAKVSEAQDRLNQMQEAGITSGRDYESAQRDLTDAQRGAQFALRILTLSMGDLIPFTLLLINSAFKLKETLGGAKTAVDATSQATTALGNATKGAASGGMAQIATSAGTATTGINNMGNASKLSNTAIGGLTTAATNFDRGLTTVNTKVQDATRLIGTTSNAGLLGGITGLNTGMDDGTKKSSKFRDAFTQIGNSIKNLPNTFKNIATSIGGFFTNFGTHIGKLPGLFKTAATAIAGFGKALLGLALNPIGLAIIGVSTAVLALASDFGGVRTAINNFGVAIGNAIPPLKGILDWFGKMANGALDTVAKFLGLKTSTDNLGTAAEEAAKKFGTLPLAIQNVFKIATTFDLSRIIEQLQFMHRDIDALGKDGTLAIARLQSQLTNFYGAIVNPTKEVALRTHEYRLALRAVAADGIVTTKEQENLRQKLAALEQQLLAEVGAADKVMQAQTGIGDSSRDAQNATLGLKDGAIAVANAMVQQAASGEKVKESTDANTESVKALLNQYGVQIDSTRVLSDADLTLLQSLYSLGPALEVVGAQLEINDDNSINWAKTMDLLIAKQYDIGQQAGEIWDLMGQLIEQEGVEGYKKVILFVDMFKAKDAELGAALEQRLNDEMDLREQNTTTISTMIDTALEGGEDVVKSEDEQMTALAKTREEITKKATELGISDKIQGLSIQNQQNAIKITEEQNKTENEAIFTLQKLATARGLDISQIGKQSGKLLTFIATNNKSIATIDEVNAATGVLIAKRQEDAEESQIQTQANSQLLAIMGKVPPVIGMTGKGLSELVTLYDDTANASGIAADEIGIWYAGLERSQAVEQESVKSLLVLAEKLQIDIPEGAEMTVEGLKKIIEGSIDMGEQAKKSADEAASAFGQLANDAGSALEDLIKEDLIKGDIDDVIEKLEDAGTSIDTLAAKQAIIKPILDSTAIDDGLLSLTEMLDDTWAQATLQAKNGGDAVVQEFNNGMLSHLGELGPPMVNHVNNVWQQIKATNPGKTGAELVQMLAQELRNPGPISQAANQLGAAVPPGVQSGMSGLPSVVDAEIRKGLESVLNGKMEFGSAGEQIGTATTQGYASGVHMFPTEGKKAMFELLSMYDPAKAEAYAKANAITQSTGQGLAAGAGNVTQGTQTGIVQPITGAVGQIPSLTGTALAPLEGTTQGAFLKAQIAANGVISMLLADINTSMQHLVTNVQNHLTSASQAWITHGSNVKTVIGQIGGHINTGVTAINTFYTKWNDALGKSDQKLKTFDSNTKTSFNSVKTATGVGSTAIGDFYKKWNDVLGKADQKLKTFASNSKSSFTIVNKGIAGGMTAIDAFWKSWNSVLGQADQKLKTFASNAKSSFHRVATAAQQAANMVKQLQSAINKLKSKSINIHVGLTGPGARFMRHGGSFLSMEPTGFAQQGKTFINSKPRKIGGVNISEFGKPELVSVMPLSDPGNPMDKGISLGMPETPKLQPIPKQMSQAISRGGGGAGGQPITVTGDTHIVIMTPDGQVLSKLVQPHLLKGFSGIT